MALRAALAQAAGVSSGMLLVVDEYQMLADPVRRMAYETVIALAPPQTRLLLLSGSVADARDVAAWLERLVRNAEVVRTRERPDPCDMRAES